MRDLCATVRGFGRAVRCACCTWYKAMLHLVLMFGRISLKIAVLFFGISPRSLDHHGAASALGRSSELLRSEGLSSGVPTYNVHSAHVAVTVLPPLLLVALEHFVCTAAAAAELFAPSCL